MRLSNLLKKNSKGHFGKQHAIALKKLASQSVGIKKDTLSLQFLQSINQIELFTSQFDEVEKSIHEIMDKMDSVVKTIPGIGNLNGTMMIGEIGDIKRFERPYQLLAYAGLDPSIYQSGKFTASRTKMSKRDSKTLRYAFINAAWQITLGHVAHKLVRIIHKIMTDNVVFHLD